MKPPVLDVSTAPDYAFGHRGLLWWGTMGLVAIEGAMFALLIVNYWYLRTRNVEWPPGVFPPYLLWGTANTVLMLLSGIPNHLALRAAKKFDLAQVRRWMVIALLFAAGFFVLRYLEFRSLNVYWDTNAYGSVVWVLLGFHTAHILTDFVDTSVLTILMFTGPLKESRFVDVAENCMYWWFVVAAWLPIYAFIYLAPRFW